MIDDSLHVKNNIEGGELLLSSLCSLYIKTVNYSSSFEELSIQTLSWQKYIYIIFINIFLRELFDQL